MIPSNIFELVSDARHALALPYQQRAVECIRIMPLLIDALDQVSLLEFELTRIRVDLTRAVRTLREKLDEAKRTHFGRAQAERHVYDAVLAVNDCLDRLDEILVQR